MYPFGVEFSSVVFSHGQSIVIKVYFIKSVMFIFAKLCAH